METTATNRPQSPSRARRVAWRVGAALAGALLCSAFLPSLLIVLGVCLLAAVTLHVSTPSLQHWLHPLLRVPVAGPARRHTHLVLVGSIGLLLLGIGAVGATTGARLRSEWSQHQQRQVVAEERGAGILARANEQLGWGDVQAAELILMEIDGVLEIAPAARAEAQVLLEKLRRSRDSEWILQTLRELPEQEFEAFAREESVPAALEFEERVLTLQSIRLARARLGEARRLRAARAAAAPESR